MLYLQIASLKSSVLNFLDSNSFEVIISIFQRTEKVPDMERLRLNELCLQSIQYVLAGIAFCLVYIKRGNVVFGIAAHMSINLMHNLMYLVNKWG